MVMMNKVIVIGAGICGLTAAYKLLNNNIDVTLLESSDQLGGLGTFFRYNDKWIDRFYHCQMPSDKPLLDLIDEIGLGNQMYWKPTRMGFIVDSIHYPFNTAFDLLRFKPISFFQRIRFGFISLFIRHFGKGLDLDNTRVEDWLSGLYGKDTWEKILAPLFISKFGAHAGKLPAYYIWERLGREKNAVKRGYIKCGLKGIIDSLEKKITNLGGKIVMNNPVESINQLDNEIEVRTSKGDIYKADYVISTIPIPLVMNSIKGTSLENSFTDPKLKYQGVVNALFFLTRELDGFYWSPVLNSNTEFDGIVEMTELINVEQTNNKHLVYTMKYCDKGSDLFKEPDENIAQRWKKQLIKLFENINLRESEISDVRIFKAPFVEPIYPLGYSKSKPPLSVEDSRLILATSAQVYPQITSWNSSVRLANEAVALLLQKKTENTPSETISH